MDRNRIPNYRQTMIRKLTLFALFIAAPLYAAHAEDFDPNSVSEVDAINCAVDLPSYNSFAMAISGNENLARKRGWKKVKSSNFLMNEYDLPAPITVAGHYSTRRIAFSSNAILAVLDLPDPQVLAREQHIENALDPNELINALVADGTMTRAEAEAEFPFRKFMGERVVVDETEPAGGESSFGAHTLITLNVSNATTHPGKTFYGCAYKMELLDKDGKPL